MTVRKTLAPASLALAAALAAGAAQAAEESGRIEIGYLECDLTGNAGNIIVSEQSYVCSFDPAEEGRADETYVAEISKFGIDLSRTDEETISWAVLAPAEKYREGVLEGEYGGVSADAAVGVGAGVKLLVGGFEDSIALQPVSVTTQEGLGLALGVENLTLKQVPPRG